MKSVIAVVALLGATGATTWDPLSFIGQTSSEASLLIMWGIALLVAGGRIRARLKSGPRVVVEPSHPLQPAVAD
jgi:hypothetical protein